MRPVAILKLAPVIAPVLGTMMAATAPTAVGAVGVGAATGAASTGVGAGVGAGIGSALMQGAKKKIGQVGVTDAASIAQNASDKATERAQQAQQNNIQSSQELANAAKEEAKVKTGEPMDIAYQLLKNWEEIPPCPYCQGTGEDPNEEGQPEIGIDPGECEPCDGTGKALFSEEPVVLDERGMPIEDDTWRDSVETGEPMDIAMRLLKESVHLTHNEDLPHQFSQDIANLDNRHEITPTKTGSAINNIHPNMLRTIQLMAENYQDNTPVQEEVYEPPTYF